MTALTINQKNGRPVKKNSPVMLAVKRHARKCLEMLATDPRVDLDTTDKDGRGLEEVAALAGLDWIDIPRLHTRERIKRDKHVFLNIIVGARQKGKRRKGKDYEKNVQIYVSSYHSLKPYN